STTLIAPSDMTKRTRFPPPVIERGAQRRDEMHDVQHRFDSLRSLNGRSLSEERSDETKCPIAGRARFVSLRSLNDRRFPTPVIERGAPATRRNASSSTERVSTHSARSTAGWCIGRFT